MNILKNIWRKLADSKDYRKEFVSAILKRGTAMQIQALMKQKGWTQTELAEHAGLKQGVISRARNPEYGNLTFNTVIEIASGFDVAFIGRFVPFSEFAKYVKNMPEDLSLSVPSFEEEKEPNPEASQETLSLAIADPKPEDNIGGQPPNQSLDFEKIEPQGADDFGEGFSQKAAAIGA